MPRRSGKRAAADQPQQRKKHKRHAHAVAKPVGHPRMSTALEGEDRDSYLARLDSDTA